MLSPSKILGGEKFLRFTLAKSGFRAQTEEQNPMERTLIILKPDCLEKAKAGATISRFEDAGFKVVGCRMISLDEALLREHYAHIADRPFFPEIRDFMSSRPVIVLILEGPNVINRVRLLLGPTDSNTAPAGTIRGDWGTDKMHNIAHASDSPEAAEAEISRFFPDPSRIY